MSQVSKSVRLPVRSGLLWQIIGWGHWQSTNEFGRRSLVLDILLKTLTLSIFSVSYCTILTNYDIAASKIEKNSFIAIWTSLSQFLIYTCMLNTIYLKRILYGKYLVGWFLVKYDLKLRDQSFKSPKLCESLQWPCIYYMYMKTSDLKLHVCNNRWWHHSIFLYIYCLDS